MMAKRSLLEIQSITATDTVTGSINGTSATIKLVNRATFIKDFTTLGMDLEDRVRLMEELRALGPALSAQWDALPPVQWQAVGQTRTAAGGAPDSWLHLHATASVPTSNVTAPRRCSARCWWWTARCAGSATTC